MVSTGSASNRVPIMMLGPMPYPNVGATRDAGVLVDAPAGFRARERSVVIGSGAGRWEFARREVLRWGVKTRAGFEVQAAGDPLERPSASAMAPVTPGETAEVRFRLPLFVLREPVRVIWVDDGPQRAGFGYGTLPGHPLVGEEAFIVERDDDGIVRFTVRAFAHPAPRWRMLAPVLSIARGIMVRRYLRALAGPLER